MHKRKHYKGNQQHSAAVGTHPITMLDIKTIHRLTCGGRHLTVQLQTYTHGQTLTAKSSAMLVRDNYYFNNFHWYS